MSKVLEAARALTRSGFSVLPIKHGSKKPDLISWTDLQGRIMDESELAVKFKPNSGIGIIGGGISGNCECLDFDDPPAFDEWREILRLGGNDDLLDGCYIQKTPRGGWHVVYRCDSPVESHLQLAWQPGKKQIRIETKGEGGYFIVAPTIGYSAQQTLWTNLAVLTGEEREIFLQAARILNQHHEAAPERRQASTAGSARPGDDYNARALWADILEPAGWILKHSHKGEDGWVRPGKTKREGIGATTDYKGSGVLKIFSSSAHPFEIGLTYTKFHAYTLLSHNGDFSAAAKELNKQGYGSQKPEPQRPEPYRAAVKDDKAKNRGLARTTLGTVEEKEVEWFWKNRWPYGGQVIFSGEGDVGKTYVMAAVTAACTSGISIPSIGLHFDSPAPVLWLAAEDSASKTLKPRIRSFGGNPDLVEHVEQLFTLDARGMKLLQETIEDVRPRLVIIDPISNYYPAHVNPNHAHQVRPIIQELGKLVDAMNVCHINIAHVNKGGNDQSMKYRTMGSSDIVNVHRAGFVIEKHPDIKGRRCIVHTKHNWSPVGATPTVEYEWRYDQFVWCGESDICTESFGRKKPGPSASSAIREWILSQVGHSPKYREQLVRSGMALGIASESSIKRAIDALDAEELLVDHPVIENGKTYRGFKLNPFGDADDE